MTPLLTVGLKVPEEGSWVIGTEAGSEFIVKRTIDWTAAYQVRLNLGGEGGERGRRVSPGLGEGDHEKRGPRRRRTVTPLGGEEQGLGEQRRGGVRARSVVSGAEVPVRAFCPRVLSLLRQRTGRGLGRTRRVGPGHELSSWAASVRGAGCLGSRRGLQDSARDRGLTAGARTAQPGLDARTVAEPGRGSSPPLRPFQRKVTPVILAFLNCETKTFPPHLAVR